MADAGITHSQLAAKLIVEGCLANVAGNVQGKMPIMPVPLTELERADVGLKQGGSTLFYPLEPTGVFLDMHGSTAIVWYTGSDCQRALGVFEEALKRAYPRARQGQDEPHPQITGARHRGYEIDVGGSRVAVVDVEYPTTAPAQRFWARITAFARK